MSELYLLEEISNLKAKLREKEDNLSKLRVTKQIVQANGLNNEEIARYSRQIILPDVGVEGKQFTLNQFILQRNITPFFLTFLLKLFMSFEF